MADRSVWPLLVALAVIVLAGLAAALDLQLGPVQAIIAPFLVLFVPGFVLLAAARGSQRIGSVEHALLGIGMSVSLIILGGLALIWAGLSLDVTLWSGCAWVLTVLAGLVALTERSRRFAHREESEHDPRAVVAASRTRGRPLRTIANVMMLGVAGVIVTAAFAIAGTPASPDAVEGYTQLWLLPRGDAGGGQITLGVRSMELTESQYAVQLDVRGTPIQDWQPIRLAPGETWEQTVVLPMSRDAAGVVNASLYRLDQGEAVYRRVTLRTVSERGS